MQLVLTLAACLSVASAFVPKKLFRPPPVDENSVVSNGTAYFDQLIDHANPSLGTFKQKYYWSDQFYAGKASPVVLMTPGEVAANGYQGYLSNLTITGAYAQAIGGAGIVLEHRYWGDSSPYQNLSTKNLQYLTLKNNIADLTHFARNVKLPFDPAGSSNAVKAPWVLSGGSYSGALSAWTENTAPGTFWAYHASSAPVEAISDFWQYFAPVQEGMPQNCSKDISLVVDYVDKVLSSGNTQMKTKLKTLFGLQTVTNDADFASALQNGPWSWQELQFYTGYSPFFQFCDSVEGVFQNPNATVPGPEGVGLQKALNGYAKWVRTQLLPGYCAGTFPNYFQGKYNTMCFDTYNATSPIFTDLTVGNEVDRQWQWMLCNEPFAYWQDGAPTSRPSIVSRLVTAQYWQRQCPLYFPAEGNYTFGSAGGKKSVADTNTYTGGWNPRNSTRLIWTNGQFDPWRSSSTSSDFRPNGPLVSTPSQPVQVIPSGIHCSDLILENAVVNAGVKTVVDNEVKQIKAWVQEFYNGTRTL